MRDVERFTEEVVRDVEGKGGIDYLVLSAGGPPTGRWRRSVEVYILDPRTYAALDFRCLEMMLTIREWKKHLQYNVYHGIHPSEKSVFNDQVLYYVQIITSDQGERGSYWITRRRCLLR